MYLLSFVSVILLTGVMCANSFGSNISFFARVRDFPAAFLLVLFLIPLLISAGLLRDFNNAFRLGIGKKTAESLLELRRAKESVSLTIKIMKSLSVFICAIQGIVILYKLHDLSALGPYIVTALLSLIYGMGIVLILLPLQARLKIKIQEFIREKE